MKQCKGLVVASGGAFKLELFLPEDYPMAAPKVRESSLLCCTAHLHHKGLLAVHQICLAIL